MYPQFFLFRNSYIMALLLEKWEKLNKSFCARSVYEEHEIKPN